MSDKNTIDTKWKVLIFAVPLFIALSTLTGCFVATQSITLANSELTVNVGDTFNLPYVIYPDDATNHITEFILSDSTLAEKIGDGKFLASAEGELTINIRQDGKNYDKCVVHICEIPISQISFSSQTAEVGVGREVEIAISISPENATNKNITYSISNPQIVEVQSENSNGNKCVISGIKEGSAVLTATSINGIKSQINIEVVPVEPESIQITGATELYIGDTSNYSVVYSPTDVTDSNVQWHTSNDNVLSIDENGNAKAISLGSATISAVHSSGVTSSIDIKVLPIAVSSIFLSGDSDTLYQGETVQLSADITPQNATDKSVTWETSDNTIATVTNGKVTAKHSGTATIYCTANNGVSGSWSITVKPTTKTMTVSVSASCSGYNSVGSDWGKSFKVNGQEIVYSEQVTVEMNRNVRINTSIVEYDSIPDVGTGSYSCKVTEEYFESGFEITQTIYVTENRGRYSGNTAVWEVVYSFKPSDMW